MSASEPITVAIGDIHGNSEALELTIDACRRFADGRPATFVMLGDYIDRGPDSKGVVELLMNWHGPERLVCIKGNHEDMALLTIEDEHRSGAAFLGNGGKNTLFSFGVLHAHQLPRAVARWMEQLPLTFDDGQRFYCHAGVDPTRPLDQQSEAVLLLSRFSYPDSLELDRYIVHGHTPIGAMPEVKKNRINLDTGSGYGGPLSAAVFTADRREPFALIVNGRIFEMSPSPAAPLP